MKHLLDFVLLIDDDEDDNFYHKRIIHKANITEKVQCIESGPEALAYLSSIQSGRNEQVNFIFLDLNMPQMNGWEFLEAYQKLNFPGKDQSKIFLLTTSSYPVDLAKANANPLIHGFLSKPLNPATLEKLKQDHL